MNIARRFPSYQLIERDLAHEREVRAVEVKGLEDKVLGQSVEIQRLKSEILRLTAECKAKDAWAQELVRMADVNWREVAYRLQHPSAATPREKADIEAGTGPRQPVSVPSHNIRSAIHAVEQELKDKATKAAETGQMPYIATAFDLKKKKDLEAKLAGEVGQVAKINGVVHGN